MRDKIFSALVGFVIVGAVVIVLAGCGGSSRSQASPVHVVNVWIKSLQAGNFGTACRQIDPAVFGGHIQQCVGYFLVQAAVLGSLPVGHAVPHSEKITGKTATVKVVIDSGPVHTATLKLGKAGWKLESVQ